jgi:hypothetical protein
LYIILGIIKAIEVAIRGQRGRVRLGAIESSSSSNSSKSEELGGEESSD